MFHMWWRCQNSPYIVNLQGRALVAHGDWAEHHLPKHIDIRGGPCVLSNVKGTTTASCTVWQRIMFSLLVIRPVSQSRIIDSFTTLVIVKMVTAYSFPQIITNIPDFFFTHDIFTQDPSILLKLIFNLFYETKVFLISIYKGLVERLGDEIDRVTALLLLRHILERNTVQSYPTKINAAEQNDPLGQVSSKRWQTVWSP